MTEEPEAMGARVPDQEDFWTSRPRRRGSVIEALLFSARVTADAGSGVAEAVAQAVRAFRHERGEARVIGKGWVSMIPEGLLISNAAFFQQMANTCRRMYESVQDWNESGVPRREAPIDYEHLARLVAAELSKQKSAEESPEAP
jgi:hypothetical protein